MSIYHIHWSLWFTKFWTFTKVSFCCMCPFVGGTFKVKRPNGSQKFQKCHFHLLFGVLSSEEPLYISLMCMFLAENKLILYFNYWLLLCTVIFHWVVHLQWHLLMKTTHFSRCEWSYKVVEVVYCNNVLNFEWSCVFMHFSIEQWSIDNRGTFPKELESRGVSKIQ